VGCPVPGGWTLAVKADEPERYPSAGGGAPVEDNRESTTMFEGEGLGEGR